MSGQLTSKNLDFKIGDIVQSYHSGFFKVIDIVPRYVEEKDKRYGGFTALNIGDEYSPVVHYVQIADGKGKLRKLPKSGIKVRKIDAAYCIKVEPEMMDKIIANYQKIVDQFNQFKAYLTENTM